MKLANVILLVSDLERSAEFYRDILGLEERGRVPGEFVFFEAGGTALALRKSDSPRAPGDSEFSFEVADVRATYDSLKSKVPFFIAPRAVTGDEARDLYAANFRDPDGHHLSITAWVAKR